MQVRGYQSSGPLGMILAAIFGFALGWFGSIPVAGPIAALVVARAIEGRSRAGWLIALGGAAAEATYACLAFWGFSAFLNRYPAIEPISRAAAALVLAGLGIALLRGLPARKADTRDPATAAGTFALGLSIGALNPTLIATWAAVVTALRGAGLIQMRASLALPFAAGVLGGIVAWFATLQWLIRRYRRHFSRKSLDKALRAFGAGLVLLSLWFAARFVCWFVRP